ncbi:hypothetical protein G9A89_017086 [Geosiphon pyriformis]|nr:hypothetical protein G9A89_017086 [Geosiphon pyriformis]
MLPSVPTPAAKDPMAVVNVTAALDVEGNVPLESVQLDGLVILKIIKHCREFFPTAVTGQLLGLDMSGVLEVTNCFPLPSSKSDDENEIVDGARYQVEMMRCLRDVNVDHNTVGWYQSTYLGSFVTNKFIETQFSYQQTLNNKSVVIVHDVSRSTHGNLSLRAFRFTQAFMEAQKEGKFITESLLKHKLTFSHIFEELPITIKNSHLVTALLHSLNDTDPTPTKDLIKETVEGPLSPNFDTLELSLDPYIEKNLEFLLDTVEENAQEQSNFAFWQRSVAREQSKIQSYLQKRKQENLARQASGLDPLPEEDISKIFKLPNEPSRLDSLLLTSQISNYCKQLNQYAGPTLGKLFVVGELHNPNIKIQYQPKLNNARCIAKSLESKFEDSEVSSINRGLCVLVGIGVDDTTADLEYIVKKILNVRVFEDETGSKMWSRSVMSAGLEILCVSQFTLYGSTVKNKPDFRQAMKAETSKEMYIAFLKKMRENYVEEKVKDGVFGAMMIVNIANEGPVTLELDSKK